MSGEAKKGQNVHAIGKGKQNSCGKPKYFQHQSSKDYKQQQKGEAQGRSQQSQIKDCHYCGKMHPRVSVPRMALYAINAADQTILRMYAKMANSVVSEKR